MSSMSIPVVIVESHQHALEHIHDVLRRKKLFNKNWSMVHFDAHPDLVNFQSLNLISEAFCYLVCYSFAIGLQ